MNNLVLDASAVIAVLQQEVGGNKVMTRIEAATGLVAMSSVNFCEVAGKLVRDGLSSEEIGTALAVFRNYVVEFTLVQAERAGDFYRIPRHYDLSLADRACLALARETDATVLTSDRIWKQLDIGVRVELIRG